MGGEFYGRQAGTLQTANIGMMGASTACEASRQAIGVAGPERSTERDGGLKAEAVRRESPHFGHIRPRKNSWVGRLARSRAVAFQVTSSARMSRGGTEHVPAGDRRWLSVCREVASVLSGLPRLVLWDVVMPPLSTPVTGGPGGRALPWQSCDDK